MRLVILFLLLPLYAASQDINYARSIVDTLASPAMHGRGYVNNGHTLAANYIEEEFKRLGLRAFKEGYVQKFSFPVNTFPGRMEVSIDGKKLSPGADYIVKPYSAGAAGTYLLWPIQSPKDLKKGKKAAKKAGKNLALACDAEKESLLFDLLKNEAAYPTLFFTKEKLTWSVLPLQLDFPALEVRDTFWSGEARSMELHIHNQFEGKLSSQNVIAYLPGKVQKDTFLVFSAHYDHLGHMGQENYFPGANDNASGVALLLNLARHYSANPAEYPVAFMAFGAEEIGLIGSRYYTEHPMFDMKKIKFLLNMDIMGTGDEGMTVVNATKHEKEFDALVRINEENNYIPQVKKRGPAPNSDHYFFDEKGVPAFFIYTMGGIAAYHDIYDRRETLPLTEYEDVFRLITDFAKTF